MTSEPSCPQRSLRPLPLARACLVATCAALALAGVLGTAATARADQLACNDQRTAAAAVALLPPGSLLIDYCSLCSGTVKVVLVGRATAVKGCDYEVAVTGTLLAESQDSYDEGRPFKGQGRFAGRGLPYEANVDLAYVYVERQPNVFSWLGGVLKLAADVRAPVISLPADLYAHLGPHERPDLAGQGALGGKAAATPPRFSLGAAGLSWYASGPLAEAVRALDAGQVEAAWKAVTRALASQTTRPLLRDRSGALPDLLEQILPERLNLAYAPLRNLYGAASELRPLEDLPPERLEPLAATLALWAAVWAQRAGREDDLRGVALALAADPITLFDLQRRSPRAALLARFYGTAYVLAASAGQAASDDGRLADVLVLGRRLRQQLAEQPQGLSGNYLPVLERLLRGRCHGCAP